MFHRYTPLSNSQWAWFGEPIEYEDRTNRRGSHSSAFSEAPTFNEMSIKIFGTLTSWGPLQKGVHPLLTMAARKANHLRILISQRWPWSSARRRNWSIGRPPCTRVGGRMAEAAGECGLLKGRRSLWASYCSKSNGKGVGRDDGNVGHSLIKSDQWPYLTKLAIATVSPI